MGGPLTLEKVGRTFERYLSLPALLIGFVVDVVALFTIFGVPDASQITFTLNPITQLTIWTAATITYSTLAKNAFLTKNRRFIIGH